jgi:hypothetical protein
LSVKWHKRTCCRGPTVGSQYHFLSRRSARTTEAN